MKLIKPHISEKTVKQAKGGQFTLFVDHNTTKGQIKNYLKVFYDLKALKINIINKKDLRRKTAKGHAKDRGFKKAIVTLDDKQQIPGFEIAFDTDKKKKVAKKS